MRPGHNQSEQKGMLHGSVGADEVCRYQSFAMARLKSVNRTEADTVRVITAEIGLAFTDVSVRASSSSTQENMKQKNAATPIPDAINGTRIFTKNFGNE